MDSNAKQKQRNQPGSKGKDATGSQQQETTPIIDRSEELKALREDLIDLLNHFMEDDFQTLDHLIEDFVDSEEDTTESDDEPETLAGQTLLEKKPAASSEWKKHKVRPWKIAATFDKENQTSGSEMKSSTCEEEEGESDAEESADPEGVFKERGTQTLSADDEAERGSPGSTMKKTFRTLRKKLQGQPGEL